MCSDGHVFSEIGDKITLSCPNNTATIHYTIDGSEPTSDSAVYTNPIPSGTYTLKAIAVVPTYPYTVTETCDFRFSEQFTPIITATQNPFNWSDNVVVITTDVEAAEIRYTLDGSEPTESSPLYTGPFTIDDTATVKAKAFRTDWLGSETATATFTREWYTVEAPVIEPSGAEFENVSQTVSLSCATDGATILYTTDGSDPKVNGCEYTKPFAIYKSCTVRAIAVKYDWKDSGGETATFTRADSLGEAADLYEYIMETDSAAPWTVDTAVSHDGVSSVRSGAIGNSSTTYLMASVKKAGTVSFWWKAQSEEPDEKDGEDGYCDYGVFLVDDVVKARIAGNDSGWRFVSVEVPTDGKHVLRWEYRKDNATSYAPDCVWLDQVQWIPAKIEVPVPAIASKEYTGGQLQADISATEFYTVQNDGGVDAGNYPVTLTLTDGDNYRWAGGDSNPTTITFTVSKATNAWITEPSILGWMYGDEPSDPSMGAAKFGTAAVTYGALGTERPTEPGEYVAVFAVEETENWSGLTKEVAFKITASEEVKLEESFDGLPVEIVFDGEGGWIVTITNDIDAVNLPIEIPDNLGQVTIDLNGHDLVGGGGKPAVVVVPGVGDGEPTQITVVNTGEDAMVQGGEGAPAIEVAAGARDGTIVNVGDGVVVQGGGDGVPAVVGEIGENSGTVVKAAYDMSGARWDYAGAFEYDGKVKTVLVSGLPSGVAVASYAGNTATEPGKYTAHVELAYDEQLYNEPAIPDLKWEIKKPYRLTLRPNSTKYGTVSGGGTYAYGSKATLKAKAKKGYVFAGWFTDKACKKKLNPKGYDNRKATVKYAMPKKNAAIYAKFVTKKADKKALKFTSATAKLAKTPAKATAGAAFSLKLGISSASLPTVTASGLPKGLSIDKTTGEITGVGTVPGSYTAKVTVKNWRGDSPRLLHGQGDG
ncbi:MAG: chitobiase/beta-hexosaminidase C-terminal domain-containing protein [Kiritimatiellae bacterium]|nr:chitobiase/beta-hexosaminidase C-terminal domain-containing protein [Kiritimatiellia bacterium]